MVISHYPDDHFTIGEDAGVLYKNKTLWIKNPNRWINMSQWDRSREFLKWLAKLEGRCLQCTKPKQTNFVDPIDDIPIVRSKNFGNYQDRREELLKKWQKRFFKMREHWAKSPWVDETLEGIHFAGGVFFQAGDTKIRFSRPLFHGIEYANTGWVISTIIEHGDITNSFIHRICRVPRPPQNTMELSLWF